TSGRVRGRIHPSDRSLEFVLRKSMDTKHDRLPYSYLADAVGRHQSFETQTVRVDNFDQLLAHLSRVARRHLAIADDAVERRSDFRAPELLASSDNSRSGRLAIALRRVAPALGVLELLGGYDPCLAQGRHALELPLGLLVGQDGGTLGSFRGSERVANSSVVE